MENQKILDELNQIRSELAAIKSNAGIKGFAKKAFSKLNILVGIVCTIILSSLLLYASQIIFNDGDIISAADVNANFSDIYQKIEKQNEVIGVLQVTDNHVITPHQYTPTLTRPGTVIDVLTTSITTKGNNTKIAIDTNLDYSCLAYSTFVLERGIENVWTEIGSHNSTSAGAGYYGIATGGGTINTIGGRYCEMDRLKIQYIDSPDVSSNTIVSYRLRVFTASAPGITFNLNQSHEDAYFNTYNPTFARRATSNVRLMEIK